jgi:hypothetical protein
LNNIRIITAVLTPKTMFPASLFGLMGKNSGFGGGGYKAGKNQLLSLERDIKQDCLTIYNNKVE